MPDIPEGAAWGTVVARFGAIASDSPDSGRAPDVRPLSGTVTLTPTVEWIQLAGIAEPGRYHLDTLVCPVIDGVLYPPGVDDEAGVPVLASNQPAGIPATVQWEASFQLEGVDTQPAPVLFDVPDGGTVDLAMQVGAEPDVPTVVVVSTEGVAQAQAAAQAAQQARTQAQTARTQAVAARDVAVTSSGEAVTAAGQALAAQSAAELARDQAVTAANPPKSGTTTERLAAPVVNDQLWWDTDQRVMWMRVGGSWQAVTPTDSGWTGVTLEAGLTGTFRAKLLAGVVYVDGFITGTFSPGVVTTVGTLPSGMRPIAGEGAIRIYSGATERTGSAMMNATGTITIRNSSTGDATTCRFSFALPLA